MEIGKWKLEIGNGKAEDRNSKSETRNSVWYSGGVFLREPRITTMSQLPRTPDLAAQRAAMQRLNFLVGNWSGEAHIFRTGAEVAELMQTERAEYKLDNLLL